MLVFFALLPDVLGVPRPYSLAHLKRMINCFIAVESSHASVIILLSVHLRNCVLVHRCEGLRSFN